MPVRVCTGFEFGTTAGWTTGNAGNKVVDNVQGTPTITTTAPRTGTYCLEVSQSGTSEFIAWDSTGGTIPAGQNRGVFAFAFRFPTALPSAAVEIAFMGTASSGLSLFFRNSDDKLVATADRNIANGQAGPVVVADTWYYAELYANISANPWTLDWWIDGVAQTQDTNAVAATTIDDFDLGSSTAQTMTCRYDDVVVWSDSAAITTPVGKHKVQVLNVDTGTAYVLNGTAANWSTFTANGTIDSSFTVTEARDTTDEWPPTIGASADGLIQDATSTTDNVEIAMTSYTLQSGEEVTGVRMVAPGWAVSGTAATFGFRSWNGTTETILFAGTLDPAFDNSTTVPAWVCKMLTLADVNTQGELDALAFRVGFSSDAAPDIGIHAIAAELAVKEATTLNATADAATLTLSGIDVAAAGSGTATVAVDAAALTLTGIDVAAAVGEAAIVTRPVVVTETAVARAIDLRRRPATDPFISFGPLTVEELHVAVDAAALTLTGIDITAATGGSSATVDPAILTLAGVDVAAAGSGVASVTVDTGTLTLAGVSPTAAGTGTAAVAADPATLTLTGVDIAAAGTGVASVTVDSAVLVLAGVDVAASPGGTNVLVDPAILTLAGIDVTAAGSGAAVITVDTATLTLTGIDLTAAGTSAASTAVDPAILTLAGIDVAIVGGSSIEPITGVLTITIRSGG